MIKTWHSFIIALSVLVLAYASVIIFPAAPFGTLCTAVCALFATYAGKRLMQKQEKFNAED